MDALMTLNPLSFGPSFGGGFSPLAALPSAASARLGVFPDAGVNPFDMSGLQNVIAAGDIATQKLMLQCALLMAGLMQNSAGQQGGTGDFGGTGGIGGTGGTSGSSGSDAVSGGGGGSGGGSSADTGSTGGSSASGGSSSVGSATGQLAERQGEKIDSSIAANFDAMVAEAKKDGVDLQIESGWRSRQEQEVLYQKYLNGTGNLAAKPGTSNHESGQAIDFKNTPGAFDWLAKNASKFGLKNLPGEPWHYSVNGK